MCNTELVSDELGYLADISKQSLEDMSWFYLASYSKMREERDKLKKDLLSKKEPELEYLENSQPIYMQKIRMYWGENI